VLIAEITGKEKEERKEKRRNLEKCGNGEEGKKRGKKKFRC